MINHLDVFLLKSIKFFSKKRPKLSMRIFLRILFTPSGHHSDLSFFIYNNFSPRSDGWLEWMVGTVIAGS